LPPAFAQVLLDGPLAGSYTYRIAAGLEVAPGQWAVVPWGRARRVGIVESLGDSCELPPEKLRELEQLLPALPALEPEWLDFIRAAAGYYQGEAAELGLSSVPKLLRVAPSARTRKHAADRLAAFEADDATREADAGPTPALPTAEQQAVLDAVCALAPADSTPPPWLLHGITGSGKTEVYVRWFQRLLATDPASQVLLLVPEIGLTPSLLAQLQRRFPDEAVAVLHSEMPDAARASNWLAAATGRARVVLGTRLAVLVPIPGLAAIVVDEEHDPSYKQQEGIRYSARDMAVMRAAMARVPILLGSATPSLESWHNVREGRYRLLRLTARALGTCLPAVRLVSLRSVRLQHGLTEPAIAAIRETLSRGDQALAFLNRRGYAPVLACDACGWLSRCDHCDACRVLHRIEARYRLICHHCASEAIAPRACPECGNQDLAPLGRGTQRLEEGLTQLFPDARIGRLDRDVARRRGATERFLAAAHAGDTNLLVGTQMLAKGHDFTRLTLVVVIDADAGLFAADFRAPERLFATLMQVAGRAGRHRSSGATTLVQTRYPEHPLFASLAAHDYPGFAGRELAARKAAGFPPFTHQALLLAQAAKLPATLAFLHGAREHLLAMDEARQLTVCDPVPMPLARLQDLYRAQLLVECNGRKPLHRLLAGLRGRLDDVAADIPGRIRWQLVIDPIEI
jgi:primosomal protein N' (replication factor Y)